MLVIVVAAILFILSLAFRVMARLGKPNFGVDTWYFLLSAEGFKKNRKLPISLPYYLLDEIEQFYPPGFSIFLSIFSKKFLENFNWLIIPVIDSVQLLVLFAFSYAWTSDLMISTIAGLFYITSPILISQGLSLNSRIFGSFFLTLAMLSLNMFLLSNNNLYLFFTILFGIILFYSHKISTQQFIFLMFGFSLFMLRPFFIFVFILILILCFGIGREFYLNLLKSHLSIIKFWAKNLKMLGVHQVYESAIYNDLEKSKRMKSVKGLRSSKCLYFLEKLKLLGIYLIVIYLYSSSSGLKSYNFLFFWLIVNLITIFSTSFMPVFKYLGEGYKYLIHGMFPLSFLLSFVLLTQLSPPYSYLVVSVILLINIIVSAFIIKVMPENYLANTDEDFFKIFEALNQVIGDRLLCLPFSKADVAAYFTRKKVLFGGHSLGRKKFDLFWPVLKKPIEYFLKTYQIDYILIDDRYLDFRDLRLAENCSLIKTAGHYKLFQNNI